MNPVSLILALVESVICGGSIAYLIMNVSSDCDPMTNLLCCVVFMIFAVLAAASWKKSFPSKVESK